MGGCALSAGMRDVRSFSFVVSCAFVVVSFRMSFARHALSFVFARVYVYFESLAFLAFLISSMSAAACFLLKRTAEHKAQTLTIVSARSFSFRSVRACLLQLASC